MDYVGIDVHKKQRQICPCTAAGEVSDHGVNSFKINGLIS